MLMRVGLSSKLSSLMFVSGPVLTLALDGAEKLLMHLWAAISVVRVVVMIPEICPQSLGHGIRKILVKKALSVMMCIRVTVILGNIIVATSDVTA
jgi:hypothetical protein